MPAPVLWGNQFIIDNQPASALSNLKMEALPDGGFVAVWIEQSALRIRTFNGDGTVRTNEIGMPGLQIGADNDSIDITLLSDGGYVISWLWPIGGALSVRGAIFNADGSVRREAFNLNTGGAAPGSKTSVVALDNGGFTVFYTKGDTSTSSKDVVGKIFSASGNMLKDEFYATERTVEGQLNPISTELTNGNIALVYTDTSSGPAWRQYLRILKSDGTPAFAKQDTQIDTSYMIDPSLTTLSDGRILVAWDGGNFIQARIFEADGTPVGTSSIFVSNATPGNADRPAVSALADGGFAIAFEHHSGTPPTSDVRVVTFDASGTQQGNQILAHAPSPDMQARPQITALADGRFVVAWLDQIPNPNSPQGNIIGQIFDARPLGLTINGTARAERHYGGAGADTLNGEGGNDKLYGMGEQDHLKGGSGDDWLWGGAGGDILDGGADRDIVWYDDYRPQGTSRQGLTISFDPARATNTGIAAGDIYVDIEVLSGTAYDDKMYTSHKGDTLFGRQGHDLLVGGNGNDWLDAGEDNDTLEGGAGDDTLIGFTGNDTLIGGADHDVLNGGADNDMLDGGANNDILNGDAGKDTLNGGGDDDELIGGSGADQLQGDAGKDTLNGGDGADELRGGTDYDYAVYWDATSGVRASLAGTGSSIGSNTGEAAGDTYFDIEGLRGSKYADTLEGSIIGNDLYGGDGNDRLYGQGGRDYLKGGADDDWLWGGAGADWLHGDEGRDVAWYDDYRPQGTSRQGLTISFDPARATNTGIAAGDIYVDIEVLSGTAYDDKMYTSHKGDTLFGRQGHDLLVGGNGNDWLDAGEDNDTLEGGAGDDTLIGFTGNDVLKGGTGNDSLEGGSGINRAVFSGTRDEYTIGAKATNGTFTVSRKDGTETDTLRDVRALHFESGNTVDVMVLSNVAPTNLRLSASSTVENAPVGAEVGTLSATDADGDELIYTLLPSSSSSFGIRGNKLVVNGPLDFESKVPHQLTIQASDDLGGVTTLTVTIMVTNEVENTPFTLWGTPGADGLTGENGNDTIYGSGGNDVLSGLGGDDRIHGGAGKDVLTGGAGKDVFVFDTRANKRTNVDKITDFRTQDDSIWLENKHFTKLGSGSVSKPKKFKADMFTTGTKAKDAEDRIVYDKKTGKLYYDQDGTGSKAQILIATLTNKATLKYHDFFVI